MQNGIMIPPGMLVTGRYQSWRPTDGIPVRTTVGHPRFWRGPKLVFVSEVAPYGVFRNPNLTTTEAMISAYRDRLDRNGGRVLTRLTELVTDHPGERMALLCYEDVLAGEECHRRWFAAWFEEKYGIEVAEVAALG